MADLSLTDMLYYILEYSDEGMPLEQLQAELRQRFGWNEPPDKLEQELRCKTEFCCPNDKWKISD